MSSFIQVAVIGIVTVILVTLIRKTNGELALLLTLSACVLMAVAAGAVRESVEIIDVEDVPLQYYPGNTCRVKIKAAGDLA